MKLKNVLALALSLSSLSAFAQFAGEKRLFTMEKNYNAENVMIIHAQTDNNCKFVVSSKNNEKNYMEFYWVLNNGKARKEVHPMIRGEIKKRVSFEGINGTRDSFRLGLNDMKEVRHDLSDTTMEVASEIEGGKCVVKSIMTLGASQKYRKIDLNRVYCEVTTNLVGIPNGCKFLDVEGTDIQTGAKVKARYLKK